MRDFDAWPDFSRKEMQCRCGCGLALMSPSFMDALQNLRNTAGFPLPVSSGYRCPTHNATVSRTGATGPHTTGRAADIRVTGLQARELLALAGNFTGIGIAQRGPHQLRFIHLDILSRDVGRPRPWVWSY